MLRVSKNVNIDGCIVEQLGGPLGARSDELELRFGPRPELRLMLLRFEPPESAWKVRTQGPPRY